MNPFLGWILVGIGILLALLTIIWLLAPMRRVGRRVESGERRVEREDLPKASVIAYSITNEEETIKYLEALTAQDYPNYEVILVMDTSYENSAMFAETCAIRFPNVYVTFIPTGSHNLSRKKLALTLGMKAAKGDVAVTTISNAAIPSDHWLSDIMAPFAENDDTEVVLGYSHLDYSEMHSAWHWRREFDDMLTNTQWIGYALNGKPYRGDGYNLAFKRELFFEHKGYSKSIHLHSGDDDLFVSEIANSGNTKVVISPEAILTTSWGRSSTRTWREKKEQYRFTSRWLKKAPFLRLGAVSAMQWVILLLLGCSIALGVMQLLSEESFDFMNILPSAIGLLALIGFWQAEILIYRKAATNLGATKLWWAVPVFWLAQPINNALFNLNHRSLTIKNFTWQRK